ncbi:hypothetical protein BJF93_14835 [Xaviernesmea oryzae]|uniref:ChrR-like cupin domain-containing protein n=2 Tax=Xaviernesmea oryzae TaxID=464029 RepID=A0A1Q9AXR4_9HYPH|nr:hypothetical protein BJF93_14835 [Xaviernesmea oryzae]SEK26922.1 ChrR Cupin-like domain-containing protein [Xaviernesmea oryzae]
MIHQQNLARQWKQTPYPGVAVAILAAYEEGGTQALLHFEAGARLPAHRHPGWESIYILEGSLEINGLIVLQGDHVLLPAGEVHEVVARETCIYMALSQRSGVDIMDDA